MNMSNNEAKIEMMDGVIRKVGGMIISSGN